MFWFFILSAAVYFLQGIEGLPSLAVSLWAKNTLHLPAYQAQRILSYATLAWLVKPLWGFFIDSYFTKKQWIGFSAIGGILLCILLGLLNLHSLTMLVCLMAILNWTMSIRDVANDGVACVVGKSKNVTGKFQAIQWGSLNVAAILATLGGGVLAMGLGYRIGYLLLVPLLLPLFFILSKVKEEYGEIQRPKLSDYKFLLDKQFLLVALFMFLYGTAPAFGMPLLYMKQDVFKWTAMQIAYLDAFVLSIELIGAWLYFKYCRVLPIKKTLVFSILLGVPTTLVYLYFTPFTAWLYGGIFGSIGMIVFLVSLDFCARKSLPGLESTSFAALMSVKNFAGWCSAQLGALTLQWWGLPTTIIIASITGLIALPIVKYIKWEEK